MSGDFSGRILFLLLTLPGLVAAFTLHEFAHAWMAHRLGDDTPQRDGRVTLDPVAHLDPLGMLMIVIMTLFALPGLGWAKPVMWQPRNTRNPRTASVLVAIAGPIANLLQIPVWLFLLWLVFRFSPGSAWSGFFSSLTRFSPQINTIPALFAAICVGAILTNIGLFAFNLIPIPPLDGHSVLKALGPPAIEQFYQMLGPFSFILLLLLVQTPFLGVIVMPFYEAAYRVIAFTIGLI